MNKNIKNANAIRDRIVLEVYFMLDKISLILLIIGGLNWGSVGIFQFDIVAWICGGQTGIISRIIYTLVALAAIWCISLLFRDESSYNKDRTAFGE